jgi:muramoyltetrapeptide carboxypeptidase
MITPAILKKRRYHCHFGYSPNIDDNLKPAIDLLHSWGLEVIIGNTIGLDDNQLAGTDEQRQPIFNSN